MERMGTFDCHGITCCDRRVWPTLLNRANNTIPSTK
jgi:hypothetical protein